MTDHTNNNLGESVKELFDAALQTQKYLLCAPEVDDTPE